MFILLQRNLSGKNLPAAIEETSGQQLPDSIREKSEKLKGMGGVASLEEKIYNLPELLTRNREILDEVSLLGCILYMYIVNWQSFLCT